MCATGAALFPAARAQAVSPATAPSPVAFGAHPSAAFLSKFHTGQTDAKLHAKSPEESRWLDEGERYSVLEPAQGNQDASDLVAYDTATGRRSVLVSARQLTPAGAAKPLSLNDYTWSADKQHLLVFTNSERVWRENTRGDYWVLDLATGKLTQLDPAAKPSTLMFAKFSPDARSVAFVRENNIYVEDLATGQVRALTTDGSPDVINGTSDWVNEEELDIRDAFRWSPDSQSIAYWQFNQSGVGDYTLINDTKALYPTTFHYKYPLVGTTNSAVRAGIVAAQGGATVWVQLPGDPRGNYIPGLDWAANSGQLLVESINRLQNDEHLYLADPHTGAVHSMFEDKDAAFLDVEAETRFANRYNWLSRGHADAVSTQPDLLWMSERDGWRHAYRLSATGAPPKLLTNFAADIISPVSVDQQHGFFYFTASPDDPIRAYLFRSRLDGTGTPERVTPAADTGTNSYDVSPNGKWAIHSFSSATTPPRYDLVELPTHRVVRTLEANAGLAERARALTGAVSEQFSETPVSGGVHLSTSITLPPGFDPSKKYPVLVEVYGEPAGAIVKDRWDGSLRKLIAGEGYVEVSFDNQGTPAPRGRAWRKAGYGSIGVLSTQQQAEGIRELAREHPYIDTTRMAIWGWSGGGTNTLNMMFRNPGLFSTGISVASVPDQTRYDTIYQERYMGLPKDNAKGYHDGSAINFAGGLAGNLLIVHGSGDDNVHYQGAELLENKLIELGKPFDFMDYPNRTHGIYEGPGTSTHVYTLIVRYLEDHVPSGPRPQ
ncbi:S9 family peptidase [Acidipila sp. EB88]|uniref:S9 family peptidase n=1 Tax=Acidipila sp. EB88 TaxID=2305226 RepID=UPI001315715F|nr:S9 family peptidase [Acidipila sp. EB88]